MWQGREAKARHPGDAFAFSVPLLYLYCPLTVHFLPPCCFFACSQAVMVKDVEDASKAALRLTTMAQQFRLVSSEYALNRSRMVALICCKNNLQIELIYSGIISKSGSPLTPYPLSYDMTQLDSDPYSRSSGQANDKRMDDITMMVLDINPEMRSRSSQCGGDSGGAGCGCSIC